MTHAPQETGDAIRQLGEILIEYERMATVNTDLLAALGRIQRGEPCAEQGCKHGVPLACAIHIAREAIAKTERD